MEMKHLALVTVGAVVLLLAGTFTLYHFTGDADNGSAEPHITGFIFSLDDTSLLVAEGLTEGRGYAGDIDTLRGNAIVFGVDDDTEILDADGNRVAYEDLEIHAQVEVWSTGVVRESYPAQADASRIVVTGEQYDPDMLLGAEEVTLSFIEEFIASAPPQTHEGAAERAHALLSSRAQEVVGHGSVQDLALFVGVQDVPDLDHEDQGVSIRSSRILDSDSVSVIVDLSYGATVASREVLLVQEEGEWKIDEVRSVETSGMFEENGYIVIDNPGMEEGVWHIIYERPGEPALTERLIFDDRSECVEDDETFACDGNGLMDGTAVHIMGERSSDGVYVERLQIIDVKG